MPHFLVRPKAKLDIKKQAKFIAKDGMSRADSFVDYIYDKFELLAQNQYIGRPANHIKKNLHVWPDKKYKVYIYYTIHSDHIKIVRVISMRQDQFSAL